MTGPQKNWNRRDTDLLVSMIESGMQSPAMARILGRSSESVRNKAKYLQLSIRRGNPEPKITEADKQAASCNALREACLNLFQRTANRYQISMTDAMACHLGFYQAPKFIRAPLKTSSAARLAA